MRIAVDVRPLAHPHTGIGRYLKSLLPYLVESDHEWFLYGDHAGCRDACEALSSEPQVHARVGNVGTGLLSTPFSQALFPRWARRDRVDLFWSPRHHLPLLSSAPRSMVTIHDLIWRKYPETMVRFGWLVERGLMPPSLKMADAILTPSAATRDDLVQFYPGTQGRIHVTPLASALISGPAEPRDGVPDGAVLMVGTLEPRKNYDRAIDAFLELREAGHPEARLQIAGGRGWRSEELIERCRRLASDGVEYLGAVDDDELRRLYAQSRLVFTPSLYEGFGLPVVEAMAYGVPVVTSNVSSLPEVLGGAGLEVDPLSVADMSAALRRMYEDLQLYRKASRAGIERAREFSWERTSRETLAVIETVAG